MSSASSSGAGWSTRLLLPEGTARTVQRPDDPRLAEIIEFWKGDTGDIGRGRAVIVGFPCDEGVRRNGGRVGAAEAPREIRRWLHRLTAADPQHGTDLTAHPPLDLGDIQPRGNLEEMQQALGEVVAEVLKRHAVPIVLGGGHETAYGHYLGYVGAREEVGIINIDAHLDVRPMLPEGGHSGSPFRQALEHRSHPLPGNRYICLGAQPHACSSQHGQYVRARGGSVRWRTELEPSLAPHLIEACSQLRGSGSRVYLTLDADVVRMADVPGVSAPNPSGLAGDEVLSAVRQAARRPSIASFELVEINPRHDRDGQSARWAAVVIWNFLMGLAERAAE